VLIFAPAPEGSGWRAARNRKKQQSNARRAEVADGGGSGGPSEAQLQEMFAAFMLTQNPNTSGPRRKDSYTGTVVELKVPVTPMSNTDQNRIRVGPTPWRSKTLQARVAATTLTRKGPERQRLAGPQSNMPLGFLEQGPLTSRLRGGERKMLGDQTTRQGGFKWLQCLLLERAQDAGLPETFGKATRQRN
jgi:hypothetical protein